MSRLSDVQQLAKGPVVLTQEGVDANKHVCHAGMQIAPKVDGWPERRVVHHLLHHMAEPAKESEKKVLVASPKAAKAEPAKAASAA